LSAFFVNYRSGDDDFAAALVDDHLRVVFGDRAVFKDSRSLTAGTDFPPELWRRLLGSEVLLVLIGQRWLSLTGRDGKRRIDHPGDFVRREIEAALLAGIRVIPVLLNDTRLPDRQELPESLQGLVDRQFLQLRQRSSGVDLGRLVEVLKEYADPVAAKSPAPPGSVVFHEGGVYGAGATFHGEVVGRDKHEHGGGRS
jgi:hypothetical protein